MSIQSELIDCMVRLGLSESRAVQHAERLAAAVAPEIARETRDRAIRDLFPKLGAEVIQARFGIKRTRIYEILNSPAKRQHDRTVAA